MPSKTYIEECLRTNTKLKSLPDSDLLHAALGIFSESGEIADQLKKHLYYGKPLDKLNLKEEIGDLFWYCAILCDYLGVTFEQIQEMNIAKLKARYGDRWNQNRALNRNLEAEVKVMEKVGFNTEMGVDK